jgi:steroid Delta-isomerase
MNGDHNAQSRFVFEAWRSRPPGDLARGYRTGSFHFDGRTLVWEYPRATPIGDVRLAPLPKP